jgi:hypothetical protein
LGNFQFPAVKNSYLTAKLRLHHFDDLFIDTEQVASLVLLKWSRQVKITWGYIWSIKSEAAPATLVGQEHCLPPVQNWLCIIV